MRPGWPPATATTGSSTPPTPRASARAERAPLLGEPHRIELVVQEVARGDGPAPHFRAVRDDAVPLQGVDVVDLLVEQPTLELADEAAALLPVGGAALLPVELVEGAVHVAAVVDRAHVVGLELEKGEVRLDDVAAVEDGRDLEVAVEHVAVEPSQLERLDAHAEPDLPPLVDQPDAERVVRVGNAAVLEREREALGHPRLPQEPPRLRA